METFYKAKIDFEEKLDENKIRKTSKVILLQTMNYQSAEDFTLDLVKKNMYGESNLNISKVKYDKIIAISNEEDELYFYEVRITNEILDDKGNTKYSAEKYLVQAKSLEDAAEIVDKELDSDSYLSAVIETDVEEYYPFAEIKIS